MLFRSAAYQDVSSFVPQYDEIGVLPPLGRWDPLQIREQGPERYRRFVEMEIKHGRLSMAAFLGVITTYSGLRWPGYLSTSEDIKFSDLPGGAISSWAALPTPAWFQIVLFISFLEINFLKQDPDKDPGDWCLRALRGRATPMDTTCGSAMALRSRSVRMSSSWARRGSSTRSATTAVRR